MRRGRFLSADLSVLGFNFLPLGLLFKQPNKYGKLCQKGGKELQVLSESLTQLAALLCMNPLSVFLKVNLIIRHV